MTAPLTGLTVVDFSRVLAGPYCTMLLAEMGADVVKVERPGTGDDTRAWGPPYLAGDAAYFLSVNRDKKSIALDLTDDADVEIARQLALSADIVVENFRDGVMARFGLDHTTLRAIRPELIYCSIPAYTLPAIAGRPGYDLLMQAASGFMSVTGQVDGQPTKVGVAVLDVIAGLYATVGVMGAVTALRRDGIGQHVTVGLFEASVAALVNQAANHLIGGQVPGLTGNAHPSIVPYQLFDAADGSFVLAAGNDKLFQMTCDVVGRPDLGEDPRLATNSGRVAHREELVSALADAFATAPVAHWLEEFERVGVPASSVRSMDEVFASPEGLHTLQEVADDQRGTMRFVKTPIGLSGTPLRTQHDPPPQLDQHHDEVLRLLKDALGDAPST